MNTAEVHVMASLFMMRDNNMRVGQAYWNAAPAFTWLVATTSFDPFNDDNNLERFLAYLRYQLGEFDDEIASVQS